MKKGDSQNLFFCLLRAGLFPVHDEQCTVDGTSETWSEVLRLAEEQSVVGLIAAGIEKGGGGCTSACEVADCWGNIADRTAKSDYECIFG